MINQRSWNLELVFIAKLWIAMTHLFLISLLLSKEGHLIKSLMLFQ